MDPTEQNPEDNRDPEDAEFNDADISTAPFAELPTFGRGLWKRPIKFISPAPISPTPVAPKTSSLADAYRAIVFPSGRPEPKSDAYPLCGVCGGPVTESSDRAHFLSHKHQAALPLAPIPSGIDRTRMGLKYLEKYGFDVDSRVGLGASGQGRLFPIVPKEKRDKLGLGVNKRLQVEKRRRDTASPTNDKLDAGKMRKLAVKEKQKHERLQRMFYGDDKVERYLSGRPDVDHGLK
ncbi:unnamed protein product [Periconia digitata]|uniref:G-patch domain-containing protein n=1 Tax=Periconia digitata TaxID=1303443 RepID=A0A9W4XGM9_9PLEO|nr:unnamed protein product [Periconia digitata]